jgi:hypothetical protein
LFGSIPVHIYNEIDYKILNRKVVTSVAVDAVADALSSDLENLEAKNRDINTIVSSRLFTCITCRPSIKELSQRRLSVNPLILLGGVFSLVRFRIQFLFPTTALY